MADIQATAGTWMAWRDEVSGDNVIRVELKAFRDGKIIERREVRWASGVLDAHLITHRLMSASGQIDLYRVIGVPPFKTDVDLANHLLVLVNPVDASRVLRDEHLDRKTSALLSSARWEATP